jgi:hypothetical protein
VSAAPSANTPATSTTRPHRREAAALTRASRLSVLWSPGVSYGRANGLAPIREARSPAQLTPACATCKTLRQRLRPRSAVNWLFSVAIGALGGYCRHGPPPPPMGGQADPVHPGVATLTSPSVAPCSDARHGRGPPARLAGLHSTTPAALPPATPGSLSAVRLPDS